MGRQRKADASSDHHLACSASIDLPESRYEPTVDCTAHPQALRTLVFGSVGADQQRKNEKAIGKGEDRP